MYKVCDSVCPCVRVISDNVYNVFREDVDLPFDMLPDRGEVIQFFVRDVFEEGAPQWSVLCDGLKGLLYFFEKRLVAVAVLAPHHFDHGCGDSQWLWHFGIVPQHVRKVDVYNFSIVADHVLQVSVSNTDEV